MAPLIGDSVAFGPGRRFVGENVKHSNISYILKLVHIEGPKSRAELTRVTGLNRSTISALVSELVELGLVIESEPNVTNQVGRPSPVVRVNPRLVALAIKPEIDAVTIAVIGFDGDVIKRIRYATEKAPTAKEVVNISAAVIEGMRTEIESRYRLVGVGVSVPGLVRAIDGCVRYAPHLEWHNEPLTKQLEEVTGFSVAAANDANIGVIAEQKFGAAKGKRHVLYLSGGSGGIGGGIVADGVLISGAAGYAGEIGHNLVSAPLDSATGGADGVMESEVSRNKLLRVMGLKRASSQELELAIKNNTDPAVTLEVERQLGILSVAIRNLVNILNTEIVVLGGYLGTLYDIAFDYLMSQLGEHELTEPWENVTVVRAALRADSLLIGAAELAFERVLADPYAKLPSWRSIAG